MTMTGYSSPPNDNANVNILLAPFGLSYGEVQILKKGASATTVPITEFAAHPITTGVTAVGVDNGYEVSGPASPDPQSNFTVYATGGGYRVGEAIQIGKGHVDVGAMSGSPTTASGSTTQTIKFRYFGRTHQVVDGGRNLPSCDPDIHSVGESTS